MICVRDDANRTVTLCATPQRIVSLVPSLTEALFVLGCGRAVVGVTRYCQEPASELAGCTQVGGTKDPDCRAIAALGPDLVIVNAEENRREDFEELQARGLTLFVTFPRNLDAAADLLRRLGQLTGCADCADAIAEELSAAIIELRAHVHHRKRVFCPIWKNPWMTIGGDTYIDDVLWTAGGENIFRGHQQPYPSTTLREVAQLRPEVVLLPDEPYRFGQRDVEDLGILHGRSAAKRIHLVDGKALSWYGPRTASGIRAIAQLLHEESRV